MVYVIPILILVAFSALFSSTETAFACVNKIRLKHMADSGDKRAEKALDIANRYEQALTAILVGNNVGKHRRILAGNDLLHRPLRLCRRSHFHHRHDRSGADLW